MLSGAPRVTNAAHKLLTAQTPSLCHCFTCHSPPQVGVYFEASDFVQPTLEPPAPVAVWPLAEAQSCLFSSSFPWTQYVLYLLVTRCPTLSSIFLFHVTVLSAWLWRGPRNPMSLPATEPNTAVGSGHTPSWAGGPSVSTKEHLTNNKGCLQEGSNSPGPCRTQAIFHPGNFGHNCGSGSEQVFKGGNCLL